MSMITLFSLPKNQQKLTNTLNSTNLLHITRPYGESSVFENLGSGATGISNTQLLRLPSGRPPGDRNEVFDTGGASVKKRVEDLGFNPYEAGIDYLRYLGRVKTLDDVRQIEQMLFPKKSGTGFGYKFADMFNGFQLVPGIKGYKFAKREVGTGAMIAYTPIHCGFIELHPKLLLALRELWTEGIMELDSDCPIAWEVCVELKGSYFPTLDAIDQRRLMDYFAAIGFKCSRCDLKIDIPNSEGLLDLFVGCLDRNLFTNFLHKDHHNSGEVGKRSCRTLYLGSPKSLCRLVIYQTHVKHGYDAIRLEARFLRGKAQVVHDRICSVPFYANPEDKLSRFSNLEIKRGLQVVKAGLIFGTTELCQVLERGNKKIKRKVVLPEWLELQEKCLAYIPIRVVIPAPEKSLPKSFGWLFSNVSKVLAKFASGFGADKWKFLNSLIDFGKERFNDQDRAEIAFMQGLEGSLFGM